MARGTLGAQAADGRPDARRGGDPRGLPRDRPRGRRRGVDGDRASPSSPWSTRSSGETDRALAAIRTAEDGMDRSAVEDAFFAVTTNAPWVWVAIGDYEGAVAASQWAMALAEQRGMDIGGGQWLTAPRAEAEFRLGRWDDALATIAGSAGYATAPSPASTQQSVLGADPGRARRSCGAARVGGRRGAPARPAAGDRRVGRPHGPARSGSRRWVVTLARRRAVIRASWSAWADTEAATGAASSRGRRPGSPPCSRSGRGDAMETPAMTSPPSPQAAVDVVREAGAYADGIDPKLDLAAAFLARRAGRDDPAIWAAAAEQLERVGYLPLAAIARQGEAEAHLRSRIGPGPPSPRSGGRSSTSTRWGRPRCGSPSSGWPGRRGSPRSGPRCGERARRRHRRSGRPIRGASRLASGRCWRWSPRDGPTARSARRCSSATRRPRST